MELDFAMSEELAVARPTWRTASLTAAARSEFDGAESSNAEIKFEARARAINSGKLGDIVDGADLLRFFTFQQRTNYYNS